MADSSNNLWNILEMRPGPVVGQGLQEAYLKDDTRILPDLAPGWKTKEKNRQRLPYDSYFYEDGNLRLQPCEQVTYDQLPWFASPALASGDVRTLDFPSVRQNMFTQEDGLPMNAGPEEVASITGQAKNRAKDIYNSRLEDQEEFKSRIDPFNQERNAKRRKVDEGGAPPAPQEAQNAAPEEGDIAAEIYRDMNAGRALGADYKDEAKNVAEDMNAAAASSAILAPTMQSMAQGGISALSEAAAASAAPPVFSYMTAAKDAINAGYQLANTMEEKVVGKIYTVSYDANELDTPKGMKKMIDSIERQKDELIKQVEYDPDARLQLGALFARLILMRQYAAQGRTLNDLKGADRDKIVSILAGIVTGQKGLSIQELTARIQRLNTVLSTLPGNKTNAVPFGKYEKAKKGASSFFQAQRHYMTEDELREATQYHMYDLWQRMAADEIAFNFETHVFDIPERAEPRTVSIADQGRRTSLPSVQVPEKPTVVAIMPGGGGGTIAVGITPTQPLPIVGATSGVTTSL